MLWFITGIKLNRDPTTPSILLGFGQGHENFQLLAQIATKNLEYFGSFKERKVEDTKKVSEVVMLRRRSAVPQKSVF